MILCSGSFTTVEDRGQKVDLQDLLDTQSCKNGKMQGIPDIDQSPVIPGSPPRVSWRMTESREERRLSFIDCSVEQIQTAITTEWCDWKFNRALIEPVKLGSTILETLSFSEILDVLGKMEKKWGCHDHSVGLTNK